MCLSTSMNARSVVPGLSCFGVLLPVIVTSSVPNVVLRTHGGSFLLLPPATQLKAAPRAVQPELLADEVGCLIQSLHRGRKNAYL